MPDPLEATAKLLNSESARNLLSPVTKNLGLLLGDLSELVRFYSRRNLERVFTKWAESGRTLNEADFEKVIPLLLQAATVSDDELQTRWANLLESAVAEPNEFLPSFGGTLLQLTAEEAQFLDRLMKAVPDKKDYETVPHHRPGREPFSFYALTKAFDARVKTFVSPVERTLRDSRLSEQQKADYDRLTQAELVVQDLERLGILKHEPVSLDRSSPARYPDERWAFTQYGVSFLRATTPKHVTVRSCE